MATYSFSSGLTDAQFVHLIEMYNATGLSVDRLVYSEELEKVRANLFVKYGASITIRQVLDELFSTRKSVGKERLKRVGLKLEERPRHRGRRPLNDAQKNALWQVYTSLKASVTHRDISVDGLPYTSDFDLLSKNFVSATGCNLNSHQLWWELKSLEKAPEIH